ncbi:MAG TPA: ABC transporter substrate-binding protein [Casimicrobiaceae bacterium]|jgi:ABC-type nitrate/sulfonate/bicarbonate transport system substrate-binding protein|nr:ABC transporter substrate-binding protein [Casimicrobiaceae bacterium]
MGTVNRRTFVTRVGAMLALPMFRASPSLAQALKMTMGAGLAQESGALIMKMQQDKLLEAAAQELGMSGVAVEYLSFPVLLRMLQGIAAGQLQFGTLGSTPCIRSLTSPDPVVPIAIAGGGNSFPLQVPPNSPIHNLGDLKGKNVLTILGSDLHLVLVRMMQAQFGVEDPKDLGVNIRNINALTELGRAQPGIDACVSVNPVSGAAENSGDLVTVLRNDGSTGPAYQGPEGNGAGHRIASFSKTPFAPEAYYPHRIWIVARRDYLAANPKAVTALLIANQRAVSLLVKAGTDAIVKVGAPNWPADTAAQKAWIDTVLWKRRGWSWITEGDARTLIGLSTTKAIFQSKLDPDTAKKLFALGADVSRAAYEAVGRVPDATAFADTSRDIRGRPVWEAAQWNLA